MSDGFFVVATLGVNGLWDFPDLVEVHPFRPQPPDASWLKMEEAHIPTSGFFLIEECPWLDVIFSCQSTSLAETPVQLEV